MVDVMGGLSSPHYQKYRDLCISAFRVAREHNREVEGLMNIMTYESNYPAFKFNRNAVVDFRARLMLDLDDHKVPEIIDGLLKKAYDHRGTRLYDRFQLATNKIAP
jgi:phosphatidylinositol kinase/protein kinase (PI-3  family)